MLWEVDVHPAAGQPNRAAERVAADAAEIGLPPSLDVRASHGFLIEGDLSGQQVERLASELLSDRVVETTVVAPARDPILAAAPNGNAGSADAGQLVHVLLKPGVMDPVAQSTLAAIKDFGFEESITVNLGLPFIRTSVDHGTAFDIAGKGVADATSMVEAIKLANALVTGSSLGSAVAR